MWSFIYPLSIIMDYYAIGAHHCDEVKYLYIRVDSHFIAITNNSNNINRQNLLELGNEIGKVTYVATYVGISFIMDKQEFRDNCSRLARN